jgi:hypothetical protein
MTSTPQDPKGGPFPARHVKEPTKPTLDPEKVRAEIRAIIGGDLPLKLRPSAMPALAACVHWRPIDRETDAARAGTARHRYFAALIAKARALVGPDPLEAGANLPLEDKEGTEWAADYVAVTSTAGEPIRCEHPLELMDADFSTVLKGTADAVCGPDLWDLKWADAAYDMQLATYALARMDETGQKSLTVHILFANTQTARKQRVTYDSCRSLVWGLINRARAADEPPRANSKCQYCARTLACTAHTEPAEAIRAERSDWDLPTFHASALDDPAGMAQALRLARQLGHWSDAVEYHARRMAQAGLQLPGFTLQEQEGRRWIADVSAAYTAAGLPQESFLACCDVRFETSKTEPAKRGLANELAKLDGMKLAPAKRAIFDRLAAVIRRGAPIVKLVAERKPKADPETAQE